MTPQERITLTAFRAAWFLCARLPERVVKRAFIFFADVTTLRNTAGVKRLQFNLARVLNVAPDSKEARRHAALAMRSYLLYYADLFRLGVYSPQELHRRARFERKEILDAALAEGRGVVVVITHSGNWDLAGAFVATQISGVTSVAERLKPEELFQAFVDVRARYGLTVLPHKGGSRPPTEILEETLREGRIVALAADRDFTRRGITAEFFGHRTTFPSGPLRLAQATGAALLYACVWTDVDTTVLTISNPIHVANRSDEDIMQEIAIKFEGGIKAHVDNWHMLQQIWPDHPREWGGRPR